MPKTRLNVSLDQNNVSPHNTHPLMPDNTHNGIV